MGVCGNHHDAWVNGADDPLPVRWHSDQGARTWRTCQTGLEPEAHYHLFRLGW